MDEFLKKIQDLYNRAESRNILTHTNFLTLAEQQIVRHNFKDRVFFYGGNEKSERVIVFFLPEYMEKVKTEDHIAIFKAKYSFNKLSHRDFLGSILALGIKRECIGDIYVFEKEAYFFSTQDISEYIITNLTKIGATGINLKKVTENEVKVPEQNFKEVKFTVQSLRLDSILAGTFRESREKMNLNIREGLVTLNYLLCENTSENVKEGDVVTVKGYGKAIISETGGKSRSGKTFITANIYE